MKHSVPYEFHIDCCETGPRVLALISCWTVPWTVAGRASVYEDRNSKTNGIGRGLKLSALLFYRQFQCSVVCDIRILVTCMRIFLLIMNKLIF